MTHTHSPRVRAIAITVLILTGTGALLTLLPPVPLFVIYIAAGVIVWTVGAVMVAMLVGACIAAGAAEQALDERDRQDRRTQEAIEQVGAEAGNVVMLWPEDRRGDVVEFPGGGRAA